MPDALTLARDILSTPTAEHWTDLQRLMAENHGEPGYDVLRDYTLEHLRAWPAKLLVSSGERHTACSVSFPNDPLFYVEVFINRLEEGTFQRTVLEATRAQLETGDVSLFNLHVPGPAILDDLIEAERYYQQDLPKDVFEFYNATDGFCVCLMRRDNTFIDQVNSDYEGGFDLARPSMDDYTPVFDADYNYVPFEDVFLTNRCAEFDMNVNEDAIHTLRFAHIGTNGHFFCLYPPDKLTEGRRSYEAAWSIGVGNDHWIALDDWIHLSFADYLAQRHRSCALFFPEGPPKARNAFSMIRFPATFYALSAEDWDDFPYSKAHTITAEDAEVVAAWFEARRPEDGWYSIPRPKDVMR